MNRDFIEDRQLSRFKIDRPAKSFPAGKVVVTGTYRLKPHARERYGVFTRRGKTYYPQGQFVINNDGTWACTLHEENPGETRVMIAKIDPTADLWCQLFYKVGRDLSKWVGLDIEQLPDGIRLDDEATISIV